MEIDIMILQAFIDAATSEQSLLSYGVLGIFSVFMIIIIRYQDKTNKAQQDSVLNTYKEVSTGFKTELIEIKTEKELLNSKFLTHLQETEAKLLTIISDNSQAFKQLVTSNESMTLAIRNLIESIAKRDATTIELNKNIESLITENKK